MSRDLLAKEKEFHRLNKELEEKTRDLMREVESVMNAPCNKIEHYVGNNTSEENVASPVRDKRLQSSFKRNASLPHVFKQLASPCSNENNEEDIGDAIKKGSNTGTKAVINFLKAKIDILHKELQTTQLEYKKKVDYCNSLEAENKKLEVTKSRLNNQLGSLKESFAKLENSNTHIQSQYQMTNTENVALKKDIEGLKKEVRSLHQQSNHYELRLNRSLENNEKLRSALKFNHLEGKELKEQIGKLQEEKRMAIKCLEKQRGDLVQAFRKQMLLVDNLKKQNAYLMATAQLQFTEEDFSRLLEWRPQTS